MDARSKDKSQKVSAGDQGHSEFIREFIIAKRELEHIKKIINEKFGVEIKAEINK